MECRAYALESASELEDERRPCELRPIAGVAERYRRKGTPAPCGKLC